MAALGPTQPPTRVGAGAELGNKLGLSWAKLSQSWIVFKLTEFCCDLNLIDLKSDNTSKIYLTKPLTYSLMIGLYWEKKLQSIRHHFRLAEI